MFGARHGSARNDDFWRHAPYAAIALIRAAATNVDCPLSELAHRLAEFNNLDLR